VSNLIQPRTLSGFRDYLPDVMLAREEVLATFRRVARSYGFTPIDTPACEALDVLLGKGGDESDKRIYVVRMVESKKEEMGLRFDLTVPFARYVVMNRNEVVFPFKRYQIQPVWRADRPQKGRYREFYQCDADVVGTTSLVCEAEIIMMIKTVFSSLDISDYTIKINHRGVLNGVAELIGGRGNELALFVAIDKLDKIGEEKVREGERGGAGCAALASADSGSRLTINSTQPRGA